MTNLLSAALVTTAVAASAVAGCSSTQQPTSPQPQLQWTFIGSMPYATPDNNPSGQLWTACAPTGDRLYADYYGHAFTATIGGCR